VVLGAVLELDAVVSVAALLLFEVGNVDVDVLLVASEELLGSVELVLP